MFDTADVPSFSASDFLTIVQHEMGHTLGFGSMWDKKGCVADCVPGSGVPNYYKCAAAQREYTEIGCTGSLPVETTAGSGSACFHWAEATLGGELMTPVGGGAGARWL